MNLGDIKVNTSATIVALSGECDSLKQWGFCERLTITKLRDGKNIICELCGCRVALDSKLAQNILVEENHLEIQ